MDDRVLSQQQAQGMTRAAEAILLESEDFHDGIRQIRQHLLPDTIKPYFEALLARQGIAGSEAVRRANLDKDYGRQILCGQRMAKRDTYIQLAFAMGLSVARTQSMLNFVGMGPIYAVRERDAAILYALERKYSLMDAQLLLERHGLVPLGDAQQTTTGESMPDRTAPLTRDVEQYVREAASFDELTEEIQDQFVREDISAYFERLLGECGCTRSQALALAGLKESIGYQLLNGTRTAKNRDAYIRLSLGLGLTLEKTQRMLKFLKKGALYPLKERDAALMFCIGHGYSLEKTQGLLARNGLDAL